MSDTVLHHFRVSYDEADERVRDFVAHLKRDENASEMFGYYASAKAMSPAEKFVLIGGNEFSISVSDQDVCHIKLRGM